MLFVRRRAKILNTEFKSHQLSIIDFTDDDDALTAEQQELDDHDVRVSELMIRSQRLVSTLSPTATDGLRRTLTRRLERLRQKNLKAPTFDGDLLKWNSFWDQFHVSIHNCADLTNAEKMVYLQNALKDNTAKRTIEGLTKSREHYEEAVKCLQTRYDRPRMVHQAHVRRIVDAPSLRDGTGKELRTLHDTVVQHLRALKALGHEPSKQFITSLLELKLDSTTMFEWQRHSQEHNDVPDCDELLAFFYLRAQAAEATVPDKKTKGNHPPSGNEDKPFPVLAANTKEAEDRCIACKGEKHPLYSCSKFRSMSHDEIISLLKQHGHCRNYLRRGHFV